ncbi:MAG: ABC transporter permease subunit [Spirochaetaceae bacterium]|jgi:ABC-2 type transport system permease protein|nr:ABC transporter permease subunit [Spirochaetaceae bacterium]
MKYLPYKALALARKELYSYSISPAFYGIGVFFLLFTSLWFFYLQRFFSMNTATLRPFFEAFPLVFILVIPVITMKSWAEERKLGSVELLLTMPFSEWDLVLGKFFSSLAVLILFMALTIPVPVSLFPLGFFDAGVILGEYAGTFLLGASATALGLFLSSLSKNQAGAFLGSAVVLLVVMLVSQLAMTFNLPLWLTECLNFISLSFHFESFSKGLIDTRDLAFFILTTALFLFLNTRVLIFRKWR